MTQQVKARPNILFPIGAVFLIAGDEGVFLSGILNSPIALIASILSLAIGTACIIVWA